MRTTAKDWETEIVNWADLDIDSKAGALQSTIRFEIKYLENLIEDSEHRLRNLKRILEYEKGQ